MIKWSISSRSERFKSINAKSTEQCVWTQIHRKKRKKKLFCGSFNIFSSYQSISDYQNILPNTKIVQKKIRNLKIAENSIRLRLPSNYWVAHLPTKRTRALNEWIPPYSKQLNRGGIESFTKLAKWFKIQASNQCLIRNSFFKSRVMLKDRLI